jgi:PEP-CTERM motif
MKPSIKILFTLTCAYAITAVSSFAQIYTFDEFGNSTGSGISQGFFQYDPSGPSGIGMPAPIPVLVYNLSFSVIPGDVVLTEPGSPAGTVVNSDLIRFWNPTGGGPSQIIFYSDFSATDPADAPADSGMPPGLMPLVITIPEAGPEGNNGALYTPTPNEPGFILSTSLPPATYNIISDVPEPSALALAALGGGLLLFSLRRRRPAGVN